MHLKRKVGVCLLAAALIAGIAPAVSAAAASAKPSSNAAGSATGAPRQSHTITLITGDRVTVADGTGNRVAVQPGPGRATMGFITRTVRGHVTVTPVDAVPLVQAGKLDSRLFDVTSLIADGYDDRRPDLPLIVSYSGTAKSALKSSATAAGATVGRDLPAVNGMAVKENRAAAGAYWNSLTTPGTGRAARAMRGEVAHVWLDGIRQPTLDVSVPLIGAPIAWQAGLTGQGVPVGVVDTGIDESHPDLAGKVVAAQNFTDDTDALDKVGHGTHVASTITGSGAASNGKYKGVAPGVKLYSAKVCREFGCAESWILAGMQWASSDQHAKVVNMSLGGPDSPGIDPLEQAVQTLTAQNGTLFVIAAGNDGSDYSVGSPGSADDALTVGAVTKQEQLADFSSRGPRIGDSALKPDITAPGVDITAARSKDGFLGTPGDMYMSLSGTSMATPHVAGSAAILAGEHPDWTPAQLKAALMAAAKPNPAIGVFAQGAGRVDIGRGIHQNVVASPASVSFGLQQWPHNDDTPVTKTVTYHNYGAADITLTLALNTTGPDGKPSASGMFTLDRSTVTVPAGGDASVTVTADTRVASPDGFAGGELTATGGDQQVQTPLGVVKEVESYDVTLVHIDRTGQPATQYDSFLFNVDQPAFFDQFDPSGTVTLRLPKGRYVLGSALFGGDQQHPEFTQLVQPLVNADHAQTITIDARTAKPVSVTVERATATQAIANVGFSIATPTVQFNAGVIGPNFDGISTAQVGSTSPDYFTGNVSGSWAQLGADGTMLNSPFVYNVAFFTPGRFFTGFQRAVKDRELAKVQVDVAAEASGATVGGDKLSFPVLPGRSNGGFAAVFPFSSLPLRRTDLFNTDNGVQWTSQIDQTSPVTIPGIPVPLQLPISTEISAPTRYQRGHAYHETWNQGVFGPAFPGGFFPTGGGFTERIGDTMLLGPALYSDGNGHAGFSREDTVSMTLFKDGTKIATAPQDFAAVDVPAAAGQYRLEVSTTRGAPFTLSTSTSVAWTFRSAHKDDKTPVALPMSAIRFLPKLDLSNTAPANCLFAVPIDVERQAGSTAGRIRTLSVQVSFDDGRTWQAVPVVRLPGGGLALLRHPQGHGFVSLRGRSTDVNGNTVEETIVRAYRF